MVSGLPRASNETTISETLRKKGMLDPPGATCRPVDLPLFRAPFSRTVRPITLRRTGADAMGTAMQTGSQGMRCVAVAPGLGLISGEFRFYPCIVAHATSRMAWRIPSEHLEKPPSEPYGAAPELMARYRPVAVFDGRRGEPPPCLRGG